jgi:nicotinate phosphoribosyltransferase
MTGALAADLCELNMAASYLWRGMVGPATFSLLSAAFRPAGRPDGHGLEDCLTFLERFHFDEDERARLGDTLGFNEPALDAFRRLRFTGEVWAVPEGRMVFAGEPLLGVTAPIAEAQLVEIVLLNQVTFHTAVASKAVRCRIAAAGADLVDFAFRRTHGVDAAMAVARASAIVGFVATSNVEAARRFGLQAAGTMAHSFIEAFPDQRAAFRAFAEDYPGRCTFLVDTYDTLGGVRAAIDVIRQLGLRDQLGVRLDSGDLGALAVQTRRLLDQAGLGEVRIVASGSLDEFLIAELTARAAPIDAYGVGTKMGVSADAPYLDSAYELVAYGDRPVLKLSPEKATVPGRKQVFRAPDAHRELVGLREEPRPRATSCCWCR